MQLCLYIYPCALLTAVTGTTCIVMTKVAIGFAYYFILPEKNNYLTCLCVLTWTLLEVWEKLLQLEIFVFLQSISGTQTERLTASFPLFSAAGFFIFLTNLLANRCFVKTAPVGSLTLRNSSADAPCHPSELFAFDCKKREHKKIIQPCVCSVSTMSEPERSTYTPLLLSIWKTGWTAEGLKLK